MNNGKKFLFDKIAKKFGSKGLVYTSATSFKDSYEVDLDLILDKFKQKAFSHIESAMLNESDTQVIIICGSVFLPYVTTDVKILSIFPFDAENIAITMEASADEIKEMSLYN